MNNDVTDDIATVIDTAYRDANTATQIYDIHTIDISSSYGYFNTYENYEYGAILKIYFNDQNAYDEGVNNGYRKYVYNDLLAFVIQFEADLFSSSQSILNLTSTSNITEVEIQTLRIIRLDLTQQTGDIMVKFNGESTTTISPTGLTMNPTVSPTLKPSHSPTKNPVTSTIITQKAEQTNYTFDDEALYWVIAVIFLFVGCCLGCGCWGCLWVNTDIRKYFDGKRRDRNAPAAKPKKRKARETERETSEEIELARKRKAREAKRKAKERDELEKKRSRYIEYGSDDDSEKEKNIFKAPPKRKTVPTVSYPADEEEISTSEDVKVAMRKVSYSTPSEEDRAKSPRRPKHRHVNKKTGKVEPIRYGTDGTRELTTKELMMQYKQKKQRGGDSVDLSYKVGGLSKGRSKDDNDIVEDEYDASQSSRGKYKFDEDDLEDENHPHFKPQHPRRKVKSTKSKKGKKKREKHIRSATGGLADLNASSPKIKYKRPRSARPNDSASPSSKGKKKSRPQSARPGARGTPPPRSPASRGSRASHKKKKRRTDEEDDYGGGEYYDEYEQAAHYQKKKSSKHHHRRHRDTDEGDGNSGSAESY